MGLGRWDEAERMQLKCGKRILGVSGKMSDEVVRGELGWWTLKGRRDFLILNWWANITLMSEDRLVKRIYSYRKSQMKPQSWCYSVKKKLEEIGLGFWWVDGFLGSPKSRLKKMIALREVTEWMHGVHNKPKLRLCY